MVDSKQLTRQALLLDFVKQKHSSQVRKYTGDPYYTHLENVARTVALYEDDLYEIAICHDLFEDTDCDFNALYKKMIEIGYEGSFAYNVCTCVKELTDKFTKEDFPHLNRKKRKQNEAERLSTVSYKAQTVKYADLIDNTTSIVGSDPRFAKTYLEEKEIILNLMNKGNKELYFRCTDFLCRCQRLLKHQT